MDVAGNNVYEARLACMNNPDGSLRAAYIREIIKYFEILDGKDGQVHHSSKYERAARTTKVVEKHFDKFLRSGENIEADKHSLILEFFKTGRPGHAYCESDQPTKYIRN